MMYTLETKIEELIFPNGCETISSALKRTGCKTLGEVVQQVKNKKKWPGVGHIRFRLIRGWFMSEVGIDILKGE